VLLGDAAGVGALAHEEISLAGTTGVAGAAGQAPCSDHDSVAQRSGGRRGSIGSAGQVPFQTEGISRRRDRRDGKVESARNLIRGTGDESSGTDFGGAWGVDGADGKALSDIEEVEGLHRDGPGIGYREGGCEIQQAGLIGTAGKLSLPIAAGGRVDVVGGSVPPAAADCEFQRQHKQECNFLHVPSLNRDPL
jgi:hypothetical protein